MPARHAIAALAILTTACTALAPFEEPDGGFPDGGFPDDGPAPGCEALRCPPRTECVEGVCVSRDPCAEVQCDAPLVCSAGECVSPLLDEDGDGFPVTSDCDDRDSSIVPGSTEVCATAC